MIGIVFNHSRLRDREHERDFEEHWSSDVAVFRACLHMVNEDFRWEEYIAELALLRDCMLEHSLVDLDIRNFLCELSVAILYLCNSLRQALIRLHQVIGGLRLLLYL